MKQTLKRLTVILLCMMFAVSFASCQNSAGTQNKQTGSDKTRKIIIDTDTGADDASALILAAKTEGIKIMGVTTLVGNTDLDQACKNALMALEIAGSNAPVFKGADKSLTGREKVAFSVFGKDGMGEQNLIKPKRKAEKTDAVSFILETVKENPGEIEIITLGPATNIALAIKKDPDTMKKVKRIWAMGSAGQGPGNASPVAEFNVYGDAEAFDVMTDFGIPVTVIGLDMCGGDAMWTDAQFEKLEKSGDTGAFVTKSFTKIREFYASNGSEGTVMNCDSLAMMCALYPEFIQESIMTHASCITDKGETYAQVIFYKKGFTYDIVKNKFKYNVKLVTKVDSKNYFDNYLDAVK